MPLKQTWKDTMMSLKGDVRASGYDEVILKEIAYYNSTFSYTKNFPRLTLPLFKSILWVESGGPDFKKDGSRTWDTAPFQIGVKGDPALQELVHGSRIKSEPYCSRDNQRVACLPGNTIKYCVRSTSKPNHEVFSILMDDDLRQVLAGKLSAPNNIRAGILYLMGKLANWSHEAQLDYDSFPREYIVKPGDSFSSIARKSGSTVDIITTLNRGVSSTNIQEGDRISVQSGALFTIISGWKTLSSSSVSKLYNGGGDPNYEEKINYVLNILT